MNKKAKLLISGLNRLSLGDEPDRSIAVTRFRDTRQNVQLVSSDRTTNIA